MKTVLHFQAKKLLFTALCLLGGSLGWSQTMTYSELYTDPEAAYSINDFGFQSDVAWATSGYSSIYRKLHLSYDNGKTWEAESAPACPSGSLLDAFYRAHYFDKDHAIYLYTNAVTRNRSFYGTSDGGATLEELSINNTSTDYSSSTAYKIRFVTENFWIQTFMGYHIAEEETMTGLIITTDGGKTWVDKSVALFETAGRDVFDLQFVDDKIGYASAYHGDLVKTTDGGSSWEKVGGVGKPSSGTGEGIVHFVDANTGYMSRNEGSFSNMERLYKTTDGGQTFEPTALDNKVIWKDFVSDRPARDAGPLHRIIGIDFYDENNGVIVGDYNNGTNLLLRTNDGGASWTQDSISKELAGNGPNGKFSHHVQMISATWSCHLFGATIVAIGDAGTVGLAHAENNNGTPSLYPNPVSQGQFSIDYPGKYDIEIYTAAGQLIYSHHDAENSHIVRANMLTKGMYLATIKTGTQVFTQKITYSK